MSRLMWQRTLLSLRPHNPCPVCGVDLRHLYEEWFECPRCKRCFGVNEDERRGDIEKMANKKLPGRPLGSKNKRRLQKLGLLKVEEKK